MRPVIDLDILFANLCFGEALAAERELERGATFDHVRRNDRIACLDSERLPQAIGFRAGAFDSGKLDGCKAILLARSSLEHDLDDLAGEFGPGLDIRIVIALATQQLL